MLVYFQAALGFELVLALRAVEAGQQQANGASAADSAQEKSAQEKTQTNLEAF